MLCTVGRADIQVLLFAEKAAIILVFVHRRDLVLVLGQLWAITASWAAIWGLNVRFLCVPFGWLHALSHVLAVLPSSAEL
jgi:hypothetical protein